MSNTSFTAPLSGSETILTSPQWLPYALALLLGYPLLIRALRYQRVNSLPKKYNYPTRESMAKMTDEEAFQIQKAVAQLEFPFIFIKSLQFALFRVRCPLSDLFNLRHRHINGRLGKTDLRHPYNLKPSNKNNSILQPRHIP